jgi:hypothetical protein
MDQTARRISRGAVSRVEPRLVMRLIPLLVLAGCGSRPAAQPPVATAPRAVAPTGAFAYDPAWGDECVGGGDPLPFGRGGTIELATCADDPPPPDGTAVPRQHTAYLVARRGHEIAATLTLGQFGEIRTGVAQQESRLELRTRMAPLAHGAAASARKRT